MVWKDYEKLFNKLGKIEPPAGLVDKILARIESVRKRQTILRLTLGSILVAASGAAILVSLINIGQSLNTSGFYQYLSLVPSDSGLLLVSWKDFVLSLAEAVPVLSLTIFLAAVWVFLQSVRLITWILDRLVFIAKPQL